MERIANIAGRVDLSKPLTSEQVEHALKANKRPTVKQAIKAGYKLEWLMPSPIGGKVCAAIAGRDVQPLPRFVKG